MFASIHPFTWVKTEGENTAAFTETEGADCEHNLKLIPDYSAVIFFLFFPPNYLSQRATVHTRKCLSIEMNSCSLSVRNNTYSYCMWGVPLVLYEMPFQILFPFLRVFLLKSVRRGCLLCRFCDKLFPQIKKMVPSYLQIYKKISKYHCMPWKVYADWSECMASCSRGSKWMWISYYSGTKSLFAVCSTLHMFSLTAFTISLCKEGETSPSLAVDWLEICSAKL